MRGKFITFEGGEGTGKSTQAAMLALRLEALGLSVHLTREPGGSPGAEIIRHVLLSGAAKPFGPDVEAMLFAAARDDHVRCTILPALNTGKWVICDRFTNSTRVYQGILGQVDQRLIKGLERVSVGDLAPDLTVVLDVPVERGLERVKLRRGEAKPDRFEAENVEFHQKLRQAYLAIAAAEPDRCVVIDASEQKRRWRGKSGTRSAPGSIPDFPGPKRTPPQRGRRIVSPRATDEDEIDETPPPRATSVLFGQEHAEAGLLAAYRSGRVPHAFLIAGPQGVGKATLAYRMARFVLAHPDPAAPEVRSGDVAFLDTKHPVARRIAAQAQPDLLIIERTLNDKGVLHKQIAVEDIRKTVTFFGSTAGEGGWRIAIVDAVDELNRSGANALLKVLEEPPERALLFLVSHSAARVPATLRSRCRILTLRPLARPMSRRRSRRQPGKRRTIPTLPQPPRLRTVGGASAGFA